MCTRVFHIKDLSMVKNDHRNMKKQIEAYFENKWNLTEEQIVPLMQAKKHFFNINWLKTIWFNFSALPFRQAVKLPFVIAYHTQIKKIGKIKVEGRTSPFMIFFGIIRLNTDSTTEKIVWSNKGTVVFHGRAKFHSGAKINIWENAHLSFGERDSIGSCTKIVCARKILIGRDFRISWEGQIFDTDFHFLTNMNTGKIYHREKSIIIGDEVFIGNRCTIGKGTILPDGATVSCCSKVSGDLSKEGEYPLIVGNPAKVVKTGCKMGNSWFPKIEIEIAKKLAE